MEHCASLTLSSEGVVSGEWSESLNSLLLSKIRNAHANPESWLEDVFVLTRLAYEVLYEHPCYGSAPNFSGGSGPSLVLAMMKSAGGIDEYWDSIERASDDDFVASTNLARWMFKMPQQTKAPIVFVGGPEAVPSPRRRPAVRAAS